MCDFADVVRRVLKIEGGYSNNSADHGGETICGVSRVYWPDWEGWLIVDRMKEKGQEPIPTNQLKALAEDLYRTHFWNRLHADDMPHRVAFEVFEMAINISVHKASFVLQEALNLLNRGGKSWPELVLDGVIGPNTMKVLRMSVNEKNGEANLIVAINALQAEYYLQLARISSTQETFLRGWLSRTR